MSTPPYTRITVSSRFSIWLCMRLNGKKRPRIHALLHIDIPAMPYSEHVIASIHKGHPPKKDTDPNQITNENAKTETETRKPEISSSSFFLLPSRASPFHPLDAFPGYMCITNFDLRPFFFFLFFFFFFFPETAERGIIINITASPSSLSIHLSMAPQSIARARKEKNIIFTERNAIRTATACMQPALATDNDKSYHQATRPGVIRSIRTPTNLRSPWSEDFFAQVTACQGWFKLLSMLLEE